MARTLLAACVGLTFAFPGFTQDAATPAPAVLPQATKSLLSSLIGSARYAEAIQLMQPLLEAYADSPDLALLRVAASHGIGDSTQCQSLAAEYLERYPAARDKDQVLFMWGASLRTTGDLDESFRKLKEAEAVSREGTMLENIQRLLATVRRERGVGLDLGGAPPQSPEEKQRLAAVGRRILERGVQDYRERYGRLPEKLEVLREGTPPTLNPLPEDPFSPGETFQYQVEGDSFRIDSAGPIHDSSGENGPDSSGAH